MRSRPSARLLLLDGEGRVLLFRFVFKSGALAGRDYWATPGGAVDRRAGGGEGVCDDAFHGRGGDGGASVVVGAGVGDDGDTFYPENLAAMLGEIAGAH